MNTNVPVGLATKLGVLGTVTAAVTSVVQSAEANQALLSAQNKPAGVIAFVCLLATVLGRMFQAANLPQAAGVAEEIGGIPEALSAVAAEAQANVAKVQATPDGQDSASVPFAEPSRESA